MIKTNEGNIEMSDEKAIELMDKLWEAGIRPSRFEAFKNENTIIEFGPSREETKVQEDGKGSPAFQKLIAEILRIHGELHVSCALKRGV